MIGAVAGGWVTAGLSSCGFGGDNNEPPKPTETTEPSPTPTQAAIGTPIAGYLNPDRYRGRTLTVATQGSQYQDAQTEAFFRPFQEATGAEVFAKTLGDDLSDLKTQVDNGVVTWDVACIPMDQVRPLAIEDYLTPIDYAYVDDTLLFEPVVGQYAVGADLFSMAIVYPSTTPGTEIPADWSDFWDVSRFGEGRSLRKRPVGTLEFALLADGVQRDQLYPLDVERAFASLERIRPVVIQWWEDGKQPAELVANGQAGLASSWNVRADLPGVRESVRVQWTGGMLSADTWVVPRGTTNTDVAMDFINYATRAIPTANFSRLLPYGPVNKDAFQYIRADRLPYLPSAQPQYALQFWEDWNYWNDNFDVLNERFLDWLEAGPEPTATETS